MLRDYLKQIGLDNFISHIDEVKLNDFVKDTFASDFPDLSEEEVRKLYIYDVPKMSADGSCSILEEKAEKPYNLAETFELNLDFKDLKNHPQTIRLWRLNKIVDEIYKLTKVEWFGIYRKIPARHRYAYPLFDLSRQANVGQAQALAGEKNLHGDLVLAKEAYKGIFSRAEFPLTKEFAKKSNNSTVGLNSKAIVIADVAAHTGAYYKCDGEVQSEFCLPILNKKNEIIGIIDAEAFAKNHFTDGRLLQIAKVAYDLGQINLGS